MTTSDFGVIIALLFLVSIGVYYWFSTKKKKEILPKLQAEFIVREVSDTIPVQETLEIQADRLNNIQSEDIGKPFAKIAELEKADVELNVKPKRTYKKRKKE